MNIKIFSFIALVFGIITQNGHSQTETPIPFQDGTTKLYGYMKSDSSIVIPAIYNKALAFKDNLARVQISGKWGFIKRNGKYFIKPENTYLSDVHSGYYLCKKDSFYLVNIKTRKKEIANLNCISWDEFHDGMNESSIPDKDLILRVLGMYTDMEMRLKEVLSIASVYEDVLDVYCLLLVERKKQGQSLNYPVFLE